MQVDPYDESLGIVEMKIGQVKYNIHIYYQQIVLNTMYFLFQLTDEPEHLIENFETLFKDIMTKAPKRAKQTQFIIR